MAKARQIGLTARERTELERRARSRCGERRHVERAQIVLLAAEGQSAAQIAGRVGCSERTVKEWRGRFERPTTTRSARG